MGEPFDDDNSDVGETSCKSLETFQFFVYHDRASLAGAALTRAYRERVSAISVNFSFLLFCFEVWERAKWQQRESLHGGDLPA